LEKALSAFTCSGWLSESRASPATSAEMVAEKSIVCRGIGHRRTSSSTCGQQGTVRTVLGKGW